MDFDRIIKDLERQADQAGPKVAIAVGDNLFDELVRRKLIRDEEFSVLGTGFFSEQVAAFKETHLVYRKCDLGPRDFQVGGGNIFRA